MTHIRQQIREEAVALATGLTTTGANVFNARVFQLQTSQLPCWNVVTGTEQVTVASMGTQERQLELIFTGYVRALTGQAAYDALDTMLEELEAVALRSAFTNVFELNLDSVEIEVDQDETEQAFGVMTATYVAHYETTIGAPSA